MESAKQTTPADGLTRPYVRTVRGPVDPDELGFTLPHEHLVIDRVFGIGLADRQVESVAAVEEIVQRLDAARQAGVTALVDVGTHTFGPSPLLLQHVAHRTPIHIVSSIGTFTSDWHPQPLWLYPPATPETIAQRLVELVEEGPFGSGVRPGILKVATGDREIADIQESALRATAIAQRETGLAISTHAHFTKHAERQVDILEDAGADLSRVVIGHMGWGSGAGDFDLHERLARRGVMLGLDLISRSERSYEEYAQMAVDLIDAGFASQLMFSHDRTVVSRGMLITEDWEGDFTLVSREFLPVLSERGVGDDVVHQITVVNPRRLLTIDPAKYPRAAIPPPEQPGAVIPFSYS